MTKQSLNDVWLDTLFSIVRHGERLKPRGMEILELEHKRLELDMTQTVLTIPDRLLSHNFMLAEAEWILTGSNEVAPLVQYAKRMASFSDDGVTLAGAYGPRIISQLDYVVGKLFEDRDTRQATLSIWTPNPAPSKDIPCTVAMDFKIRQNLLNIHVFMRSSDVWLGLPYDAFSFSMVATEVARQYNNRLRADLLAEEMVYPGTLYLTAASSHLYMLNYDHASSIIQRYIIGATPTPPARFAPSILHTSSQPVWQHLRNIRLAEETPWWR